MVKLHPMCRWHIFDGSDPLPQVAYWFTYFVYYLHHVINLKCKIFALEVI